MISEGREVKLFFRDTMKVGDKYGFLFGLGITSNFLVDYYRGGDTGTWKAIKVAAGRNFQGYISQ